jgi:branched-chain amino acid transport system ATP-binding protein
LSLLSADNVTVDFGGHRALANVDIDVAPATITGLIGPNGAGKTTMFNVICGLQETTSGRVSLDDSDLAGLGPHERARRGIARTFQRIEIFGSLTARENILVAAEIRNSWAGGGGRLREEAEDIIQLVGLGAVAEERADSLSTGVSRLVELGRALATRPRVLLLDEPSSGLDESETEDFALLLERLSSEGLAILLVEHDVELVMRLCSQIHVLDFGRKIAAGSATEIQTNQAVQAAYLGTAEGSDDAA